TPLTSLAAGAPAMVLADCIPSAGSGLVTVGSFGVISGPPGGTITATLSSTPRQDFIARNGGCNFTARLISGTPFYLFYTVGEGGPVLSRLIGFSATSVQANAIIGVGSTAASLGGQYTFTAPQTGGINNYTLAEFESTPDNPGGVFRYEPIINGNYTVIVGNIDSLNSSINLPQVSPKEFNGKGSVLRDKAQPLGLSVTTISTTDVSIRLSGNIDNEGYFIPNTGSETGVGVCILNTDTNNCINARNGIRLENNLTQQPLPYSLAYVQRGETVNSGVINGQIVLTMTNQ
ncbi:fimbrial protein, partial [Pantoea endophytica]